MHTKRIKGMILKIDLEKYFDQVSWLYIHMLLTHLGFPLQTINWIMWCITSISFSILINGAATNFFHVERGLHQGCPLSPLLFLLLMEGLSRWIIEEISRGRLKAIKLLASCVLTHLLFVDDIILFLNGTLSDTSVIRAILHLFCTNIGMHCNNNKSTLTCHGCTPHEIHFAQQRFPFNLTKFEDGLKYLGFFLKPVNYKIVDWNWLITKIEKRLNNWCHR